MQQLLALEVLVPEAATTPLVYAQQYCPLVDDDGQPLALELPVDCARSDPPAIAAKAIRVLWIRELDSFFICFLFYITNFLFLCWVPKLWCVFARRLGRDHPGGDACFGPRRATNTHHKLPTENSAQIPRVWLISHLI